MERELDLRSLIDPTSILQAGQASILPPMQVSLLPLLLTVYMYMYMYIYMYIYMYM